MIHPLDNCQTQQPGETIPEYASRVLRFLLATDSTALLSDDQLVQADHAAQLAIVSQRGPDGPAGDHPVPADHHPERRSAHHRQRAAVETRAAPPRQPASRTAAARGHARGQAGTPAAHAAQPATSRRTGPATAYAAPAARRDPVLTDRIPPTATDAGSSKGDPVPLDWEDAHIRAEEATDSGDDSYFWAARWDDADEAENGYLSLNLGKEEFPHARA